MSLNENNYFSRLSPGPSDGRTFDQRTLEAVNRTAYDVGSYRQFIIALDKASNGGTIIVSGVVTVPETILINKQVSIQCIGRGAFIPGASGLTMFRVKDIANVYFLDVRVLKNKDIKASIFIEHIQTVTPSATLKNVTVRRCFALCDVFMGFTVEGTTPKTMSRSLGANYGWTYLGNRSMIDGNIHYAETKLSGRFLEGAFYMCTVTNNESRFGSINLTNGGGTGNIVSTNVISGELDAGGSPTSIRVDTSCQTNIFTSNIVVYDVLNSAGGVPLNTVVSNNREFLP